MDTKTSANERCDTPESHAPERTAKPRNSDEQVLAILQQTIGKLGYA